MWGIADGLIRHQGELLSKFLDGELLVAPGNASGDGIGHLSVMENRPSLPIPKPKVFFFFEREKCVGFYLKPRLFFCIKNVLKKEPSWLQSTQNIILGYQKCFCSVV